MDQILYHYTDFVSLDGILNRRELRVNNVLNMNDAAEMELFISGIFNAVKKRFSQLRDQEMVERLNIMQEATRVRYFDFSAYAACFSEFRDDAAQWERYANRGKGVCICFSRSVMEQIIGGAITLQKVFYQSNVDDHPLVDRIFKLLQNAPDNTHPMSSPELKEAAYEACRTSASFKHPSFLSEHEIRLVVMPFDVPQFALKPQFHVARDRIKKYYSLDLDNMCRQKGLSMEDLVVEIMIGPESSQSAPILRDYLYDSGLTKLADRIVSSDCPLRSKI